MLYVKGKYNIAKVFIDDLEEKARLQIQELCDQKFCAESIIRIMPDVHAGKGCTIGTTMTIQDKIVPNLVGVDIGCGLQVVKLKEKSINLDILDKIIHKLIPAGFNIRKKEHEYVEYIKIENLRCKKHVDLKRAYLSVGTLGGGNHFIEVNKDKVGNLYLVVHSGSRHLGKQVAEYYQKLAWQKKKENIKKDLAYVEGEDFADYLHDMKTTQHYAVYNRKAIIDEIINSMNLTIVEEFTTIHNYIDMKTMILRKGAISAQQGEKLIIPINMRDGSIIAVGKGNQEWNYSAPHGAGRVMSRRQAKKTLSMKDFQKSMQGIYSTSIKSSTLDEAPMVYKPIKEIINNIRETVEIIDIIRPIYNFKA